MDLVKIFAMQKELDNHILKEQGLTKTPFNDRVLAFIVELGECANEWKGFKFWKVPHKRKPNTWAQRGAAMMPEDQEWYNPLLEEFVDKVHFIASLGISMNVNPEKVVVKNLDVWKADSITEQYILMAGKAYELYLYHNRMDWNTLLRMLLALGEMLGFSKEQIEDAYIKKNTLNHERQVNGY